ncbi:hypothetical protein [Myxosarcina sp. GI1(2024)]
MSNWWLGTALILASTFATLKLQSVKAIASNLNSREISTLKNQQTKLLAQQQPVCSQLATGYSKVYAFETQSFCIGICQTDEEFFYLRQSRTNPQELLILPATAVFGGKVFQAIDGKTIYFVGIDANGHYSSVMHNDDEIVFEPEIQSSVIDSTPGDRFQPAFTESIPWLNNGENSLDTNNNRDNSESTNWKVCTLDRSKLHPMLNDWQKLFNASLKTSDNCQAQFTSN